MGSGTTILTAKNMKRNSLGIEIMPEYYDMVRDKIESIAEEEKTLFSESCI